MVLMWRFYHRSPGANALNRLLIQTDDFDLAAEYQLLRELSSTVGAVVTFTGLVRDFEGQGSIDSLSLQHYPGMTEKLLQEIVEKANNRWNLIGTTVIHRVGKLLPCDHIVLVGVASQHRADAFEAAQFLMDYLKTQATFWKSVRRNGEQRWIESKASDQHAARRWERAADE